jgi:hypothetical protein
VAAAKSGTDRWGTATDQHIQLSETAARSAWASGSWLRSRSEALASGDGALSVLHQELSSYPAGEPDAELDPAAADIAVPLRLRHGDRELAFVSTRTTFGTAVDVTVAELSIESFFSADAETAEAMRALL